MSRLSRAICAILFAQAMFLGNAAFGQFLIPTNGPEGGYVFNVNETGSGDLFAVSYDLGVYESLDTGQSWHAITHQLPFNTLNLRSDRFDRLYSWAFDGRICRRDSTDGWWYYMTALPIEIDPGTGWGLCDLCIDSQDRTFALYTPDNNGSSMIFASYDFGDSWQRLENTPFDSISFRAFRMTVDHWGQIWISGGGSQPTPYLLYKSSPDLETWDEIQVMGSNTRPIMRLLPDEAGNLFVNTRDGIFRYNTNTDVWIELSAVVPSDTLYIECLTPAQSLVSYQGDGIYESLDQGDSWVRIGNHVDVTNFNFIATTDGELFATCEYSGIVKLSRETQEWTQSCVGINASSVVGLEFSGDSLVYSSTRELSYQSADHGNTWILAFDRKRLIKKIDGDPSIYFASHRDTLFRSVDEGGTWFPALPNMVTSIEESAFGTFIAGGDSLWRSVDRGQTWMAATEGVEIIESEYRETSIIVGGDAIFAILNQDYEPQILRSLDDGITWGLVLELLGIISYPEMMSDSYGHVYCYGTYYSTGFWRSDDQGETWITLDHLPSLHPPMEGHYPNEIFAASDGRLYAQDSDNWWGMETGGIFVSEDFGVSWDVIPEPYPDISCFAADANGYLFAGTTSGVYISSEPIMHVERAIHPIPNKLSLFQNYPNPFNSTTTFAFDLPKAGPVTMQVFDITGRLAATPVKNNLTAGFHTLNWDANSLASGIYFYRLKTDQQTQTRKLTLIK